jgi:hypothetical protein
MPREPRREADIQDRRERDRRPRNFHPPRAERISDRELALLRKVGSFRIIDPRDLPDKGIRDLIGKGLLTRSSLLSGDGRHRHEILALTKRAGDLIEHYRAPGDKQRVWVGRVKPREIDHDLNIYRVYQKELALIERNNGVAKRAILDYELKSIAARAINKPGPNGPPTDDEKADRRQAVAKQLSLPIINGELQYPDVRIEYLDKDGQPQHLDSEYITPHYHGSMLAAKHASGFRLHYGGQSSPSKEEHDGAI